MPELPEVETVCRGLSPHLVGQVIARVTARRRDLRRPLPRDLAKRLEGARVTGVERRAKYILVRLEAGPVLVIHLGMSGRMTVLARPDAVPPAAHDHVLIRLGTGAEIRFNDARRFGLMALVAADALDSDPLFRALGPDPFDPALDGAALAARLRGKSCTIKAALLDQRVIAGIGNIYASEALFGAGLSPSRKAGTVTGARAEKLLAAVRAVLERAIAAGGSSLRDYVQASGELGYFQHQWAVYDKEGQPCPGCDCDWGRNGGVRRLVQQGRSTFYCPRRQR